MNQKRLPDNHTINTVAQIPEPERRAIIEIERRKLMLADKREKRLAARQRSCFLLLFLVVIASAAVAFLVLLVPSVRDSVFGSSDEDSPPPAVVQAEPTAIPGNVAGLQATATPAPAVVLPSATPGQAPVQAPTNTSVSAPPVQAPTSAGIVAQPTLTPAPAIFPGRVVIDDTFVNGISDAVWEYEPSQWGKIGTTLTSLGNNAWLITRQSDFENYVVEVWLDNVQTYGYTYFGLNLRDNAGVDVGVRLDLNNETLFGALYTSNTTWFKNIQAYARNRQIITGSEVSNLRAPNMDLDDGLYVQIQVRGNQFIIQVEGQEVLTMQPFDASTKGAIGIMIPAQTRIQRVRITLLE